jgi:UDP-2-acetamido-2-deoxy-ribo-hexuluronate aminotransferase
MNKIEFIDLKAQRSFLGSKIDDAISRVLAHGGYIMGPEVKAFESQLAEFSGADQAVSCSNGTDALSLALMAMGVSEGDAVFVPSFTFAATAEVVALTGATPVFVEIQADTFNMDPAKLTQAVNEVIAGGELAPRAVIAVDLFGQIADYPELRSVADSFGLKLVADAAQGLGATLDGKQAIEWADVVTTSFFPAKPLGCYGDGGAVLTNDADLAAIMESLRVHGKGSDKYDNVRIGMNCRLDTIQAAILIEKLAIFSDEIAKRNAVANRYSESLKQVVKVPYVMPGAVSTWAQYTLVVENRDEVQKQLKDKGVPSAVYYPKPLHQQTAYKSYPVSGGQLPISEQLSGQVLSLPMHPYMERDVQDYIIESVKAVIR